MAMNGGNMFSLCFLLWISVIFITCTSTTYTYIQSGEAGKDNPGVLPSQSGTYHSENPFNSLGLDLSSDEEEATRLEFYL